MYAHNVEDYISEAIDSLVNQSLDFEENVELIIVDGQSDDDTKSIALEYENRFPKNITVLSCEDDNAYRAYNMALDHATGDYINFMGSIDALSDNALNDVKSMFSKNSTEVIILPVSYLDTQKYYPLKFKFHEDNPAYIDLRKEGQFVQVEVNTAFIKKEAIGDLRFNDAIEMADALFINEILLDKKTYMIALDEMYYVRERFSPQLDDETVRNNIFSSFELFYNKLIDDSMRQENFVPSFVQNTMLYFIQDIVRIPEIDGIFPTKTDMDRFWDEFLDILNQIDENEILNNRFVKKRIREFLIFLKNDDFHIEVSGKEIYVKTNDYIIHNLHKTKIYLDIVKIRDGFLYISGSFSSGCDKRYISVEAVKSGNSIKEIYEAKEVEYPNTYRETLKYLSIPWYYYYNFDFKIPVGEKELCSVFLKLIYNETGKRVAMDSRLTFRKYVFLTEHGNYSVFKNQTLLFKKSVFYIRPHSYKRAIYYEIKVLIKILISNTRLSFRLRAIFYRILYFITYPFMKNRKIWLFSDRRDLSCDNGEHFFNYAIGVKDDIKKYFVIEGDCEDYRRLKRKYGKSILAFGSFKHKFLFMFTEKFMQSQISPTTNNPFRDFNMRLYAGLANGGNYFVQHGIGPYDMSSWMTQYDKNMELVLTVGKYDFEQFTNENYNFDEEIVKILGFPRYDNLTNENLKKQIVIMPTWRNYIRNANQLINSEYYFRFNNLINNERLINHAKSKGYEIMLKPHPLMYDYIDNFDKNDFVKVDNITKHHEILCDSSLMITDYSSVAFDFGYLKKPVIYYQYEGGSDHHFDVGSPLAEPDVMNFGDVIKDEDELIDKIIYYMDNDCEMEDKFQKRVDNFFRYTDKNNSKRVYEWVYKH